MEVEEEGRSVESKVELEPELIEELLAITVLLFVKDPEVLEVLEVLDVLDAEGIGREQTDGIFTSKSSIKMIGHLVNVLFYSSSSSSSNCHHPLPTD